MTPTILCIDDDPAITRVLKYTLSSQGFAVFTAANASDALDVVRMIELDIIILDIVLPDVDGFGFFDLLATEPKNRGVPVIVLSGCETDDARRLAQECGAVGYLRKPCDVSSLLTMIERHLAMRQPRNALLEA